MSIYDGQDKTPLFDAVVHYANENKISFHTPGHEHGKVRYFVYNGGTPKYVAAINDVVAKDYEGIVFDSGARPSVRSEVRPSAAE